MQMLIRPSFRKSGTNCHFRQLVLWEIAWNSHCPNCPVSEYILNRSHYEMLCETRPASSQPLSEQAFILSSDNTCYEPKLLSLGNIHRKRRKCSIYCCTASAEHKSTTVEQDTETILLIGTVNRLTSSELKYIGK